MAESSKKTYGKSEKEIKAYEKELAKGLGKTTAKAEAWKKTQSKQVYMITFVAGLVVGLILSHFGSKALIYVKAKIQAVKTALNTPSP